METKKTHSQSEVYVFQVRYKCLKTALIMTDATEPLDSDLISQLEKDTIMECTGESSIGFKEN